MKRAPNNRPCICGCKRSDHALIFAHDNPDNGILYCRKCPVMSDETKWCYNYTPIGNIEYLEWLNGDKK